MAPGIKIVVIGAGFAGATVAREIKQWLPSHALLTVVSEESYKTYNPMLAEVVGASISPEHVVAPVREMLPGSRFVMGQVTHVDIQEKTLDLQTLKGAMTLPFDHLILAYGNRARLDLIPGMKDYGLVMKTVGDAMHIRNVVLRRLAQIELETDSAKRIALGHFVVVGGGFSGVEVAGALIDCLKSIHRYYPQVREDEMKVTLLHNTERLLHELPESLGIAAAESLTQRGVNVRLKVGASKIEASQVWLSEHEALPSETVICTIGTQPNALTAHLGLPSDRGRILTQDDFQVKDTPGVWAIGDCALIKNALDQQWAPPTAQFAVAEAKHLSRNLQKTLNGKPTVAFGYRTRGMMATVGHLKGVALVGNCKVTGLLAWMIWRAYYLMQMPTLRRKVRIFVEWTWGMFFPADITHYRFNRSQELIERDASAAETHV